jgi:cobalt/nickel transport system ATP-binding protein
MSGEIFAVSDVDYRYPGGLEALRGISFSVTAGECVAILGANASGKSTLLHLLDGLYFAARGEVRAFGTVLTEQGVETPPFSREFRQRVGFLFQNSDAQLFCATVEEEIAFGPLQLRLPAAEVRRRVDDTLGLFQLDGLRGRSPQSLSGGEKKKVALAGTIACGPKVILMDEPSSGLDPRTQAWLGEFIVALRRSGVTLIISSHDLSFVAQVAERALVLSEDHRLLFDGPVHDALHNLELLLSANLIHAHAHVHDGKVLMHAHRSDLYPEHQHRPEPS